MKSLRPIWNKTRDVSKAPVIAVSPNQILASTQHCSICNEIIGKARADELVERAAILPCSHIFGDLCISRWLEIDSAHQDCPICRRRLIYRECGHTIKPCDVANAPTCVEEKDMPKKCFACRGDGAVEAVLALMNARRMAEEKVLLRMRKSVSGFFGDVCGTTVASVDQRIEEVRRGWKNAADAFCSELQEKEGRDQW